jgi:flagellar basal-body rod protein FlgC
MSVSVFRAIELAGRALSAQRTRLDVVSNNLANAQTTRTPEGGPYRRRDVVLAEDTARDAFGRALVDAGGAPVSTVKVEEIREDTEPPRMVHDPGHPDADAQGYVAYPNVNTVEEMVNMITTMRSYQANLSVFTNLKDMAQRALGIGRSV